VDSGVEPSRDWRRRRRRRTRRRKDIRAELSAQPFERGKMNKIGVDTGKKLIYGNRYSL
jgi:hypothetical protein